MRYIKYALGGALTTLVIVVILLLGARVVLAQELSGATGPGAANVSPLDVRIDDGAYPTSYADNLRKMAEYAEEQLGEDASEDEVTEMTINLLARQMVFTDTCTKERYDNTKKHMDEHLRYLKDKRDTYYEEAPGDIPGRASLTHGVLKQLIDIAMIGYTIEAFCNRLWWSNLKNDS